MRFFESIQKTPYLISHGEPEAMVSINLQGFSLLELDSPLLLIAFESDDINWTEMDGRKFT